MKLFEPVQAMPITPDALFNRLEDAFQGRYDESFIEQAADALAGLSANRRLIVDFLDRNGGVGRAIERFNIPQSFILARRGEFILRVNVWQPMSDGYYSGREKNLYSYDLAHNHDFRFLTIGHFGPGYVTELCEVDPDTIKGVPGESVDLFNEQTVQLSQGRILYFEPFRDVHSQRPPDSLSISINLILSTQDEGGEQYEFDIEARRLLGFTTQGIVARTRSLIEFATMFADARTTAILAELGRSPIERVRLASSEALAAVAAQTQSGPGLTLAGER